MPHKPRHTLATLDPDAANALPDFVKDFEPVWAGAWARNQETVTAGRRYVEGLLLPGERKSMEPLSGRVNAERDEFYQFITRSPWEWMPLQDRLVDAGLRRGVLDASGGLYVDDVGVPKKGDKSVGVARQYCGVLGKVDNCQALVTMVWGAPAQENRDTALWPLGIELYLPKEWAGDAARREEAGVPVEVRFRTKNQIALDRLERIRSRVPHAWIGTDAAYGSDGAFRSQLRSWREPHVVGVRSNAFRCRWDDLDGARAGASTPPTRQALTPKEWADHATWRTLTWSQGTHQKLQARVARVPVRVVDADGADTGESGWLVLERRGSQLKAWLAWGFNDASLEDQVRMAHHRWTIEDAHGLMKGELGLDHFEGRKWNGLHHHASLVLLALAFLETLRLKRATRTLPDAPAPPAPGPKRGRRPKPTRAAGLPPVRAVVRALTVLRFARLQEAAFGTPRKKAEKGAPAFLRMMGVNV